MNRLRALTRSHARLTLALLVLALAMKALVPAGFMLSATGERFLTVTICADASGAAKTMQIAIPAKDAAGGGHAETADKDSPCAFSGLGHAAIGGADPALLLAAIAFILLVGLAPLRAAIARDIPFLRPPLRGPPVPTI